MKTRGAPFCLLSVLGLLTLSAFGGTTPQKVFMLMDTEAYQALTNEVNQWKADVNAEGRYQAEAYAIPPDNPALLRLLLALHYQGGNLAGVILAGRVPYVMCEQDSEYLVTPDAFPVDTYFTDFDAEWYDLNLNGIMDSYYAFGGFQPDIWAGRLFTDTIKFNSKTRIDLLRAYFQKNHQYRAGTLTLPKSALVYYDIKNYTTANDFGKLYPTFQTVWPDTSSGTDYLNRLLPLPGNELVYLDCHSSAKTHQLTPTWIASDLIHAVNPKAFFLLLDTCQSGHFTETNYLAGSYLFDTKYPLFAMAATTGSGYNFPTGFQTLSAWAGEDWGSIFMHFAREQSWSREYILLGDPTLIPHLNPPQVALSLPYAFSSAAPLKIPRPASGAAQEWRIPIRGKLTVGAGNWLRVTAANAPAGMAPRTNDFHLTVMGLTNAGDATVAVTPTTTLGKRQLTVVARDSRGKTAALPYWIEVVAPPATGKPDFTFTVGDTNLVFRYGEGDPFGRLTVQAQLTTADLSAPMLVNLVPVNWPDGFSLDNQTSSPESWSGGFLLQQKGVTRYTYVTVRMRRDMAPGQYVLPLKARAMGVEKTVNLTAAVLPPSLEVTTVPSPVYILPGDEASIFSTVAMNGNARVYFDLLSYPGIEVQKVLTTMPFVPYGGHSVHVWTDWDAASGAYSLLRYQVPDMPGAPVGYGLDVVVRPQFTLDIELVSGGSGGVCCR